LADTRSRRPLHSPYEIAAGSLSNSYAISSISNPSQQRAPDCPCRAGQQERFVEEIEEPPSGTSNLVIVGRNSRGNWVAQEENGLFGGLFVSRAQAVKYALFENGHHPETILLTAHIVELDMHRQASSSRTAMDANSAPQSRAA
jgi:hypothetical protein